MFYDNVKAALFDSGVALRPTLVTSVPLLLIKSNLDVAGIVWARLGMTRQITHDSWAHTGHAHRRWFL